MVVQVWTISELAVATAAQAQKTFGIDVDLGLEREGWVYAVASLAVKAHGRGDGVAVYVNHDLGSPELGQWQVVTYGGARAQLETRVLEKGRGPQPEGAFFTHGTDDIWTTLPDMGGNINWRYQLEAICPAPQEVPTPEDTEIVEVVEDEKPTLVHLTVRVSPGVTATDAEKLVSALVENGLSLYSESNGEIGFAVGDTTGTDAFDKGVAVDLIGFFSEQVA